MLTLFKADYVQIGYEDDTKIFMLEFLEPLYLRRRSNAYPGAEPAERFKEYLTELLRGEKFLALGELTNRIEGTISYYLHERDILMECDLRGFTEEYVKASFRRLHGKIYLEIPE
jgi:hypothetical protein